MQELNREYKTKNGSQGDGALPWTNKLGEILKVEKNGETNSWQVVTQNWESCQIDTKSMENFCGFVQLNNNGITYKLKVARMDDGKWNVMIVKKEGKQVSYYDPYIDNEPKWKIAGDKNNFESLVFDKQSRETNDPWQKYQNSIIFPKPRSS